MSSELYHEPQGRGGAGQGACRLHALNMFVGRPDLDAHAFKDYQEKYDQRYNKDLQLAGSLPSVTDYDFVLANQELLVSYILRERFGLASLLVGPGSSIRRIATDLHLSPTNSLADLIDPQLNSFFAFNSQHIWVVKQHKYQSQPQPQAKPQPQPPLPPPPTPKPRTQPYPHNYRPRHVYVPPRPATAVAATVTATTESAPAPAAAAAAAPIPVTKTEWFVLDSLHSGPYRLPHASLDAYFALTEASNSQPLGFILPISRARLTQTIDRLRGAVFRYFTKHRCFTDDHGPNAEEKTPNMSHVTQHDLIHKYTTAFILDNIRCVLEADIETFGWLGPYEPYLFKLFDLLETSQLYKQSDYHKLFLQFFVTAEANTVKARRATMLKQLPPLVLFALDPFHFLSALSST